MQYRTEVYSETEIDHITDRIFHIIEQGVRDPMLSEISILSDQDTQEILSFNNTDQPLPQALVHILFTRQALNNLNMSVISTKNEELTYKEVYERSCGIAKALTEKGVNKGDIVGIIMDRSFDLPISIIGILKSGAAFLPISPQDSDEHKETLLSFCKTAITDEKNSVMGGLVASEIAPAYSYNSPEILPEDLAYVMFTSGSTGDPKGAKITHGALALRLKWMYDTYGCEGVTLQKTINTFDVSIWELLMPLAFGGKLHLLEPGGERFPDTIAGAIIEKNISIIHFVPSMLELFLNYVSQKSIKLPSLKQVFASGEALRPGLADKFYQTCEGALLHNLYGPTECTIDVSYHRCFQGEKEIPIGKPVYNTQLYVANSRHEDLPPGCEGELCISGDLVGLGYLNGNSESFSNFKGKASYFTGDFAVLGFDGELYYRGRKDSQQKLRGMRIDTTSVENTMLSVFGVRQAAVILKDNRLVGYYAAENEVDDLFGKIAIKLPHYSVPSVFVRLDEIPLLENGKADRKTLQSLIIKMPPGEEASTEQEKLLCRAIADELNLQSVSLSDKLSALAPDSLSIIKIVAMLEQKGIMLQFQDFYQANDVKSLLERTEIPVKSAVFLSKVSNEKLLLCVPCGGADPQIFNSLLGNINPEIDVAGINMPYFNDSDDMRELSLQVLKEIEHYREVVVLGYCVGSAAALALAYEIQKTDIKLKGLIICSSLPAKGWKIANKVFTPWDIMTNNAINRILNKLRGENRPLTKKVISQFRKDAGRFFVYMTGENKFEIKAPIFAVFGGRDKLNGGFRKKCSRWQKYTGGEITLFELPDAGHFLVESHSSKLTEIINKMWAAQFDEEGGGQKNASIY